MKNSLQVTSATRQVRQQWFSVCIFPLGQLFGLTGNRPQSAPACSFPLATMLKRTAHMNIIDILRKIPDKEDKITIELFRTVGDIKQKGFLDKENAIKILKWKSPRPLIRYESNSDEDFKEITKLAFDTKNEKLKIHILTYLKGVSYPAASALLMFYDKTKYPVIDIRVWKELYNVGLVTNNERGQGFTLEQWWTYLNIIRKLAMEMDLTARQVEKRLFDNNKLNQKGTLYKQDKK